MKNKLPYLNCKNLLFGNRVMQRANINKHQLKYFKEQFINVKLNIRKMK